MQCFSLKTQKQQLYSRVLFRHEITSLFLLVMVLILTHWTTDLKGGEKCWDGSKKCHRGRWRCLLHTGSIKAFLVTDRVTTGSGREPLTVSAPLVRAFVKFINSTCHVKICVFKNINFESHYVLKTARVRKKCQQKHPYWCHNMASGEAAWHVLGDPDMLRGWNWVMQNSFQHMLKKKSVMSACQNKISPIKLPA